MTRTEGIRRIDNAQWEKDGDGCLNLRVKALGGGDVCAWLQVRPAYCDRGHIMLQIDGPLGLDNADSFPRYFFSFEEADRHTREFLKWRLYRERTHPHAALVNLFGAEKEIEKCE